MAVVLITCHAYWTLPEIIGPDLPKNLTESPNKFSIASSNLLADNQQINQLTKQLLATQAEVIVVQELTPANLIALESNGFATQYPHRILDPLGGVHGSGIFSKLPLTHANSVDVASSPMTEAQINIFGTSIHIVNVHTVAPLSNDGIKTWTKQLKQLAQLSIPNKGVILLVGDFNATNQHAPMINFANNHWKDYAPNYQRWLPTTWPADRLYPALMQLDHVLVKGNAGVSKYNTFKATGSDHLGLFVQITVGS